LSQNTRRSTGIVCGWLGEVGESMHYRFLGEWLMAANYNPARRGQKIGGGL
jgi:hypothetical protein